MNEIDLYISAFEPAIQGRLREIQRLFKEVVPQSSGSIRYQIPAFQVGKRHLYFAAYKRHIGFYPVYGLEDIEADITPFRAKGTKDSLHFLHTAPLPLDLIKKIIKTINAQKSE